MENVEDFLKTFCNQNEEKSDDIKNSDDDSHSSTILAWLERNYEVKDGSSLPRCLLYEHYLDSCKKVGKLPIGAAIFGKLIHAKFHSLTTRRLGTRGQSKYHYYGLALKTSSELTQTNDARLTRFTGRPGNQLYEFTKKHERCVTSIVLDYFPKIDTKIKEGTMFENIEKIKSFLVMYKAHCQRVLEAVVAANFDDVKSFILHFWCGMPSHVNEIIKIDEIPDVVSACDKIFYQNLIDIIIPTSIQEMPESYRSEISKFSKSYLPWLDICMMNVPKELASAKMNVGKIYIKQIQRQLSFLSLAQPVQAIISNRDLSNDITQDLEKINFVEILGIGSFKKINGNSRKTLLLDHLHELLSDVCGLLTRQAPITSFLRLLDKLIDSLIIKPFEGSNAAMKSANRSFILQLSQIVSKILQDLTLRSAKTFGSIHIFSSMIMEYIFLVIESKMLDDEENRIWKKVEYFLVKEKVEKVSKDGKRNYDSSSRDSSGPNIKRPRVDGGLCKGNQVPEKIIKTASCDINIIAPAVPQEIFQTSHYESLLLNQGLSNTEKQDNIGDIANWMQGLPSLQDMVTNNGWIDVQNGGKDSHFGNEVIGNFNCMIDVGTGYFC